MGQIRCMHARPHRRQGRLLLFDLALQDGIMSGPKDHKRKWGHIRRSKTLLVVVVVEVLIPRLWSYKIRTCYE